MNADRDHYARGQRPDWVHPRRRVNRDLRAPRGDGGYILCFIAGVVLTTCGFIAINGWHL